MYKCLNICEKATIQLAAKPFTECLFLAITEINSQVARSLSLRQTENPTIN